MSRGKHLSLEEARDQNKLASFAKEHPSEGDVSMLRRLFTAMTGASPKTLPKDE